MCIIYTLSSRLHQSTLKPWFAAFARDRTNHFLPVQSPPLHLRHSLGNHPRRTEQLRPILRSIVRLVPWFDFFNIRITTMHAGKVKRTGAIPEGVSFRWHRGGLRV